ncbi:MAG: hypothetical protein PHX72_00605 [Candidatus Shapirobacteria bacterium]|nr:hypothetical protein [Candidatus Shapirobacteria bacterium]
MMLIIFLVLSGLFFSTPKNCLAQSFSLSITPPILEAMIQPGKKIIYTFDLQNHSPVPIDLTARMIPFEAKDNQGHISLLNENPPNFFNLLNADMDFNQVFSLDPKQKLQLVVRIAIPNNQPEGDYYQTLLVEQFNPKLPSGNINQSLGAVGSNILLTISQSGQPQRSLDISSFSIQKAYFNRIVDSFDIVSFEILLENTGQAFVKPEGSIFLQSKGDKDDIHEIKIRPDNILPGTVRQMKCLEKPCFFKPPQLIGSYQARFEFILDGKKYQSGIAFWVFPIKITLGITIFLITLLIFLWHLKQKRY